MAKFSKKVMGKEVGSAETYAKPHDSKGNVISGSEVMINGEYGRTKSAKDASISDPLTNGVAYGTGKVKTEGVETRGNGAATKGRIARGPMA
jgi:hypothetical protein